MWFEGGVDRNSTMSTPYGVTRAPSGCHLPEFNVRDKCSLEIILSQHFVMK